MDDYYPKGLENFSLNCYMNSILQCLFYCKEFREKIINMNVNNSETMLRLLKDLFVELKKCKLKYLIPKKIKNKLNEYELFEDYKEADALDLLEFIFNSIIYANIKENSICESVLYEEKRNNKKDMFIESKSGIDFKNIINEFFLGFYEKEFKCNNNHFNYSFQSEYRIIFPLEEISLFYKNKKENLDLDDCFLYILRKQEIKEKCFCKKKFNLTEKIYKTPEILIIILDRGKNKLYKKIVKFPENLDLLKYIDEEEKNKFSNHYKLIGVLAHKGNSGRFGHYISFCLCDDNNYYRFDDKNVEKIKFERNKRINDYPLYEGSAYILFYKREKKYENQNKMNYNKNSLQNGNFNNTYEKININKLPKIKINFKKIIIDDIDSKIRKYDFSIENNNETSCKWKNKKKDYILIIFEKECIESTIFIKNITKGYYTQTPNFDNHIKWKISWNNDEISLKNYISDFHFKLNNFYIFNN